MTREEHLEKIFGSLTNETERYAAMNFIAAEIRAAVEEAFQEGLDVSGCCFDGKRTCEKAAKKIADAYEDAAKIVDLFATDPYTSDTGAEAENMAAAIRARAAEASK